MKKGGLIINNISAINEQFSQAIDMSDKKIADTNFFTKQLNGELASITREQNENDKVDASEIDITKMGLKTGNMGR